MSYRLITYTVDEIILNYEDISRAINEACDRPSGHYRITGVCQSNEHVCFPCEQVEGKQPVTYILAPISGETTDELAADLHTRWRSGFTTLGIIQLPNSQLGLFAQPSST